MIWWPDDPNGENNSNQETFASWEMSTEPHRTVSWPLLGEGEGNVVATTVMRAIPQPPKNMALLGGTANGSTAAPGPTFTAADLEHLRRGQILIANQDATADSDPETRKITRAQFDSLDCSIFVN